MLSKSPLQQAEISSLETFNPSILWKFGCSYDTGRFNMADTFAGKQHLGLLDLPHELLLSITEHVSLRAADDSALTPRKLDNKRDLYHLSTTCHDLEDMCLRQLYQVSCSRRFPRRETQHDVCYRPGLAQMS